MMLFLTLSISSGIEAGFNSCPEGFIGRVEINLRNNTPGTGDGLITLKHIDELKRRYSDEGVSYFSTMNSPVWTDNSFQSAKIILTEYNHINFINIT